MEKYPLWFHARQVGDVTVQRKGLYYHIACVCDVPPNGCFRVSVHCGDRSTDLGICVPEEGVFALRRQIPIKRIGNGEMQFYLDNQNQHADKSIPIYEDQPFAEIAELEKGRLIIKGGSFFFYCD